MAKHALTALGALLCVACAHGDMSAPAPSYHETARLLGPDGGWDYANFDTARRRVYVAHATVVTAIDAATGRVLASYGHLQRAHQALPLGDGHALLVTDGGNNTARFLDADTGAEIGSAPTGDGPDAAVFEPATGLVAVMNHRGGTVTLIDPQTRTVAGEIVIGGTLEFAVADGTGRLFVNVEDQAVIAVVNVRARNVEARIALPGCEEPSGLAYAAAARRLIAACGNNQAAVVDPTTQRFDHLIEIGAGPDAVMYDPIRRVALIPCGRSGELDVISASDARAMKVVTRVPTQTSARTGTVDPSSGVVYLPAASFNPPAAQGQRPMMQPGSFVVIVLSP